ncbi:MAG: DUF1844 domain-containing protein [Verrucomicrobia bacterium]|nr:DUF1844 domain-containing protein [Verrucomicrobiota bacterium]
MSETPPASRPGADPGDMDSALFAQLVLQQSNLALMCLGRLAHPETGQALRDLDAARVIIDTLEMLQRKTQGNLRPPEDQLLRETLMTLQLSYVEAMESPAPQPAPTPAAAPSADTGPAGPKPEADSGESHKKFTKKY